MGYPVGTPGTPFTLQGDNASVDLADAGHYLLMYNLALTGSGSKRTEMQGLIELAGLDIAYGRSSCYIRLSGGANDCWMFGSTIIEVTAGQDVKIEAQRTDTNTATITRRANESGLTLLKLNDSWDYARIQEAVGGQAFDSTTFATVAWDTNDELDTSTFSRTGGDITLATAGHYLVTVNVKINNALTSGKMRRNIAMRLTLDGTEIAGTRTTSYMRGSNGTNDFAAVYSGIIETTGANQVLRVQAACDGEDCSGANLTNVGGQSAITIAKLPDTADYIRLYQAGGGQDVDAVDDPILWDTEDEEDTASFSHSTVSNTSRIEIDAAGDFLFFGSFFTDRGTTNGSRVYTHWEWRTTGTTIQQFGSFGKYSRGEQSTDGTFTSGGSGGIILSGLTATDYVELLNTDEAGGVTDSTGTFTANRYAVQGVRLGSLFP